MPAISTILGQGDIGIPLDQPSTGDMCNLQCKPNSNFDLPDTNPCLSNSVAPPAPPIYPGNQRVIPPLYTKAPSTQPSQTTDLLHSLVNQPLYGGPGQRAQYNIPKLTLPTVPPRVYQPQQYAFTPTVASIPKLPLVNPQTGTYPPMPCECGAIASRPNYIALGQQKLVSDAYMAAGAPMSADTYDAYNATLAPAYGIDRSEFTRIRPTVINPNFLANQGGQYDVATGIL